MTVTESRDKFDSSSKNNKKVKEHFFRSYDSSIGFHTAVVLGSILMFTIMYLLYKTKCRRPFRRRLRKIFVLIKNSPAPKTTNHKCVGTAVQPEDKKGSWVCFDNPNIAPSVEIDALKATALWIMQNHQENMADLNDVSGIILRVDPEVIHANGAKEKAAWMSEQVTSPFYSEPLSKCDTFCYESVHPEFSIDPCASSLSNVCGKNDLPTLSYSKRLPFSRLNSITKHSYDEGQKQNYSYNTLSNEPHLRNRPPAIRRWNSYQNDDSTSDSLTEDDPLLSSAHLFYSQVEDSSIVTPKVSRAAPQLMSQITTGSGDSQTDSQELRCFRLPSTKHISKSFNSLIQNRNSSSLPVNETVL